MATMQQLEATMNDLKRGRLNSDPSLGMQPSVQNVTAVTWQWFCMRLASSSNAPN